MNDVLAVMQDDWVMMALPFFFGALFVEVIWAYRSHTQHYESVDFWTSMRVMLLTVFVDLIPKFLGISLMFVAYSSPFERCHRYQLVLVGPVVLLDDLTYYSFHRGNHEIRLLWAGHVSPTAPSTTTSEQPYARASASASSNTRSGCRWRYLATTQP